MKKTTAILTCLILAGASLAYQYHRNERLHTQLAAAQRLCQSRIARLQAEYQAELQELQQYLMKTNTSPPPAQAATDPAAAATTQGDDAPESVRKPALERYNESMEELVARKYRFLLTQVSETDRPALIQLLIARERLDLQLRDIREYGETPGDTEPGELELQLAEIDQRI
jgi:hypothetical protein